MFDLPTSMRHQFLETNVSLTFGAAFCFVVLPTAIGRVVFGFVVQWIVFQIPILKMQVRFLPRLHNDFKAA
jgi:hypothetical protein